MEGRFRPLSRQFVNGWARQYQGNCKRSIGILLVSKEDYLVCSFVALVIFCCACCDRLCNALLLDLYVPLSRQMITEMATTIMMEDKTDTETIIPITVLSMVLCVIGCNVVPEVKFTSKICKSSFLILLT